MVYHRQSTNPLNRSGGSSTVPGWWASSATKSAAISFLQELIDDDSIVIHSQRLIRQLIQYRGQWDKLARDAEGGHYDLTAAFALVAWAYRNEVKRGNVRKRSSQSDLRKASWDRLLERLEGSSESSWNTRWGQHK